MGSRKVNPFDYGYDPKWALFDLDDAYDLVNVGDTYQATDEFWDAFKAVWHVLSPSLVGKVIPSSEAPIRRLRPVVRNSRDYGYEESVDLTDDRYDFVKVGSAYQTGDEHFFFGSLTWAATIPQYNGQIIERGWSPIRRLRVQDQRKVIRPDRWSCGHGKEEGAVNCCVCIVFHRNVTI